MRAVFSILLVFLSAVAAGQHSWQGVYQNEPGSAVLVVKQSAKGTTWAIKHKTDSLDYEIGGRGDLYQGDSVLVCWYLQTYSGPAPEFTTHTRPVFQLRLQGGNLTTEFYQPNYMPAQVYFRQISSGLPSRHDELRAYMKTFITVENVLKLVRLML